MGIRLLVEVLDYAPTTLTHREKLLLAVLAKDARDETRTTWSSVEDPTILRRAKVTRPQVYEVLKALIAKGTLKRLSAGQKHAVAKYMLLPLTADQCPGNPDSGPGVEGPDFPDTDPSQHPGNPDTDAEAQCPETADTEAVQCPQNPDTDGSQCPEIPDAYSTTRDRDTSLSRQAVDGAFASFWREYPRKVGKQTAAKAFAAAIKGGASAEHITAAAIKHRQHWQATNRQLDFIPYPATWLRAGSYDDELHTPQQPPTAQQRGLWADPTERGIF